MTKEEQTRLLYELETRLHSKEVRNSREEISFLIEEDFMEFGKSGGIYSKNDILEELENETVDLKIEVSDFRTKELSPDVVLVTYVAVMPSTDQVSKVSTNRSSIWIFKENI